MEPNILETFGNLNFKTVGEIIFDEDEELQYDKHCHMEGEQGGGFLSAKNINGPNGTFTIPEQDQ
jgi:hypothetical protein